MMDVEHARRCLFGAAFFAMLLSAVEPARADVTTEDRNQAITFARHEDITPATTFDNTDADAVMAVASALLRVRHRTADCACCVSMVRSGDVTTYDITDDVITTDEELDAHLASTAARFKVVTSIAGNDLCDIAGMVTLLGCAKLPGNSIVIVSTATGEVFAHEFGHNQNLPERQGDHLIMDPDNPLGEGDTVNVDECTAFWTGGADAGTCTLSTAVIPTVSQWGVIAMTLLLLSAGSALWSRRAISLVAAEGGPVLDQGWAPPFDRRSYALALAGVLGVVTASLTLGSGLGVELRSADLVGALLCAPILAYVVHFWFPTRER